MKKLMVVQPYLAAYRVPFWHAVSAELADWGIQCTLAVGTPVGDESMRADVSVFEPSVAAPMRLLPLMGRSLRYQGSWKLWKDYDALILEASGSLLDTSIAVLGSRPVGLWGHIAAFTEAPSRADRMVEAWQLRRAAAVLAYTARGAEAAVAGGVPRARVSVLYNTIDTTPLVAARERMSRVEADAILGTRGWQRRNTYCFIGGIDRAKRIGFLADALDQLARLAPNVRLLVAGRGRDETLLERAAERGQVRFVGRAGALEKAAMARVASAILMPGRVGLVAVDSFALGLPIVTTDFPFHAPEFDYLSPGVDSLVVHNDVASYVSAVINLAESPELAKNLREGALAKAGWPSLSSMVTTFVNGSRSLC